MTAAPTRADVERFVAGIAMHRVLPEIAHGEELVRATDYDALLSGVAHLHDEIASKSGATLDINDCRYECNPAVAAEFVELQSREAQLREALVHAVSAIQTWHNMGIRKEEASALWDIYWRNAPEMAPIRAALNTRSAT